MSRRRPTEATWDSDDDLLNEDVAGINAFPAKKFEDEILDEDALLASDDEAQPTGGNFTSELVAADTTAATEEEYVTAEQDSSAFDMTDEQINEGDLLMEDVTEQDYHNTEQVDPQGGADYANEEYGGQEYAEESGGMTEDAIELDYDVSGLEFEESGFETESQVERAQDYGEGTTYDEKVEQDNNQQDTGNLEDSEQVLEDSTNQHEEPEEEEESESDEEDENNQGRGRFRSERTNIITLTSAKTRTNIPDKLEISEEDQAKIEHFESENAKRNMYKHGRGRGGMRGRGGRQQQQRYPPPQRGPVRFRPNQPNHNQSGPRYPPPPNQMQQSLMQRQMQRGLAPPHLQQQQSRPPPQQQQQQLYPPNNNANQQPSPQQSHKILINPHFKGPVSAASQSTGWTGQPHMQQSPQTRPPIMQTTPQQPQPYLNVSSSQEVWGAHPQSHGHPGQMPNQSQPQSHLYPPNQPAPAQPLMQMPTVIGSVGQPLPPGGYPPQQQQQFAHPQSMPHPLPPHQLGLNQQVAPLMHQTPGQQFNQFSPPPRNQPPANQMPGPNMPHQGQGHFQPQLQQRLQQQQPQHFTAQNQGQFQQGPQVRFNQNNNQRQQLRPNSQQRQPGPRGPYQQGGNRGGPLNHPQQQQVRQSPRQQVNPGQQSFSDNSIQQIRTLVKGKPQQRNLTPIIPQQFGQPQNFNQHQQRQQQPGNRLRNAQQNRPHNQPRQNMLRNNTVRQRFQQQGQFQPMSNQGHGLRQQTVQQSSEKQRLNVKQRLGIKKRPSEGEEENISPPKLVKVDIPSAGPVQAVNTVSKPPQNKAPMSEEERLFQNKIEEQKLLRERIKKQKEANRQKAAEQRRAEFEKTLASKGMTVEDLQGEVHSTPQTGHMTSAQQSSASGQGQPQGHSKPQGQMRPNQQMHNPAQMNQQQGYAAQGRGMGNGRGQASVGRGGGAPGRGTGFQFGQIDSAQPMNKPQGLARGQGQNTNNGQGRGRSQGQNMNNSQGPAVGRGGGTAGRGAGFQSGRGNFSQPINKQQSLGRGQGQNFNNIQGQNMNSSQGRGRGQGVNMNNSQGRGRGQGVVTGRGQGQGRGLNQTMKRQNSAGMAQVSQPVKSLMPGVRTVIQQSAYHGNNQNVSFEIGAENETSGSGQGDGPQRSNASQSNRVVIPSGQSRMVISKDVTPNPQRIVVANSADLQMQGGDLVSIDNLTSSTSEGKIRMMCQQIGPVKSVELLASQRKAIVRFSNRDHAQLFAKKYNRHMLDLSHISVMLLP